MYTTSLPVWASFFSHPSPVAEKKERSRPPSSCLRLGHQSLKCSDNKSHQTKMTKLKTVVLCSRRTLNLSAFCPPEGQVAAEIDWTASCTLSAHSRTTILFAYCTTSPIKGIGDEIQTLKNEKIKAQKRSKISKHTFTVKRHYSSLGWGQVKKSRGEKEKEKEGETTKSS